MSKLISWCVDQIMWVQLVGLTVGAPVIAVILWIFLGCPDIPTN